MGKALYRKYRSKSLDELVGQDHITTTLKNALEHGNISHAYLLTGPKGVGKTSVARILAHEVNGFAYDEQKHYMDIIEIDAASNRRIDEIRDLRDKVRILPTEGKYKVYIIDEVHMLTREAFNALLKTLEEPPEHAIFILATTEAHKLPDTIVSRTQHFAFRPIQPDVLVQHLKNIAKSEKISVDDDALLEIAEHGGGSFRDSISLLDQLKSADQNLTKAGLEKLLGMAPSKAINNLYEQLQKGLSASVLSQLELLRQQGVSSSQIAKQLSKLVRNSLVENTQTSPKAAIKLLQQLVGVLGSIQPDRQLEVVLLEYTFAIETPQKLPAASKPADKPPANPVKTNPEPEKTDQKPKPKAAKAAIKNENDFSLEQWPLVLASVKKHNNTLYGILRMSKPEYESGTLTLWFRFAFHQKQLNEKKNQAIIQEIIKELSNAAISIDSKVQHSKSTKQPTKQQDNGLVDTVSNIFGGGEVLES